MSRPQRYGRDSHFVTDGTVKAVKRIVWTDQEEVEALFYFISNLYLTLYPIRTLSIPFPNFTAVHGVGVAQAKPACKHTIATRKCYQYNTMH